MARHTPHARRAQRRARRQNAPTPAQDVPQGAAGMPPEPETSPATAPADPTPPQGPRATRRRQAGHKAQTTADSVADAPSADAGWLMAKGPARVAAALSGLAGIGLLLLAQEGRAFAPDQTLALAFLAFLLAWRKALTGWPVTTARVGRRWGFALAALAALGAGTTLVLAGPTVAAAPIGVWAVLLLVHARDARA